MIEYDSIQVVNKRDNVCIYYKDVASVESFYDERGKSYHRLILSDGAEATFNDQDWEIYRKAWVKNVKEI